MFSSGIGMYIQPGGWISIKMSKSALLQGRIKCIQEVLANRNCQESQVTANIYKPAIGGVESIRVSRSLGDSDDAFPTPGPSSCVAPLPFVAYTNTAHVSVRSDIPKTLEEKEEESLWAQFDGPGGTSKVLRQEGNDGLPEASKAVLKRNYKSATSMSQGLDGVDQTESKYHAEAVTMLKDVFKLDQFRPNQLEAINSTLDGRMSSCSCRRAGEKACAIK